MPAPTHPVPGDRMPAEWEPQTHVWLAPPHNAETWPGCLAEAQTAFRAFTALLMDHVNVCTTDELGIPTIDAWIRDFGPLFVQHPEQGLACHDFRFNGWGDKYEDRTLDDAVTAHLASHLGVPCRRHDEVLEGGSIDVNGTGTVMTTASCLLNPNRNPDRDRAALETMLHAALGTRHTIWLPGGIAGDDTDGHIDDVARFTAPTTVAAVRASAGHPDHAALEANWAALGEARTDTGARLERVALPSPEPILYDYPPDRFGHGGRHPVPASYANFLISNDLVAVPVFGQRTDDRALGILREMFPGRTVRGIRAEALVVGLGGLHCLSQQQPAA